MNFIKFLFSKTFLINIALLIIAIIIIIFAVFKWLDVYTNHGEYITLNDFNGLTIEQTIDILTEKKLNYVVLDTNSYREDLPNYAVVIQEPMALDKVKEGRTIYLYLSTNKAPLKEVPFLAGNASKEAGILKLKNFGFKIGEIIFKASDSEGNILDLMIDSVKVKKGQKAPIGTTIDLIVGGGLKGKRIQSPCLIGKTLTEAEFWLNSRDLNIGHIDYSKVGNDTSSAVVFWQRPNPYDAIRVGEPIDIKLIRELPFDLVNKCDNDTL